mgnify:CR=1 FL=1|jgi:UDP-galactopyranose mutase
MDAAALVPVVDHLHPKRAETTASNGFDIICFSHLRWDFVYQRPQHLMARFAKAGRVFFIEEPLPTNDGAPHVETRGAAPGVHVLRPRLPNALGAKEAFATLATLLREALAAFSPVAPLAWFYTPQMLPLADEIGLGASLVVYDCMDELSAFRFADPHLCDREADLLQRADVVFTGGLSLYEAKKSRHDNIHAFPSSVDHAHFASARAGLADPPDQAALPRPRIGYYGVIDERLDLELIAAVAAARPDYAFVFVGPAVKVDPSELPRAPNIHYLGFKDYAELPAYLSNWSVASMPFAMNEATRFISPTKTLEYLAGGKPVVSTPVRDVVRQHGALRAVKIAADAAGYVRAIDRALEGASDDAWRQEADAHLAGTSWESAYQSMESVIRRTRAALSRRPPPDRFPAPGLRRRAGRYDVVVAGAGFAGAVMAERLASSSGLKVLVCDKRDHIGGNAYDRHDAAGLLIHPYGPHIFHTNSQDVVRYLSRFTRWRAYEHRVLADVGGQRLPMPINRATVNGVFGISLETDAETAAFLTAQAAPVDHIRTARDAVVSQVGERLYRTFFEGYTRKQWGVSPEELDKSVTQRVPARHDLDDRYFTDSFQAMPAEGYTRMFENMLDHPNIDLALGVAYEELEAHELAPLTIYTGPIDSYFNCCFGALPYRSLAFEHRTLPKRRHQPVGVVNYPSLDVPYTRVTEFKHLTGQVHPSTSICYEFARPDGDPYYPIPRPENALLYKRYEALARHASDVIFLGRLGSYRYYNMDQVVGQALATHRRLQARGVGLAARVEATA